MFDDLLRRLKDRWLAPLARVLGPGIAPDVYTVLAWLLGMAAAFAVWSGRYQVAAALWIANRIFDGLDGTMARVHDRQSDFGGYLDIVLDFVVYAAIPAAMVLAPDGEGLVGPGIFLLSTFFVNSASWMYLAAILERRAQGAASRGELTTITMPPGIVAGTETFAFYLVFLLVPAWRAAGFVVMGVLVCGNVVQRLWWARRALD
jgi:phosphatidylglycerophosphate synthase